MSRRATLITGGSSGIGLALARRFHARGEALFVVSLDGGELAALRQALERPGAASIVTLACDLTASGAVAQVLAHADASGLEIDTLVNCAGFGLWGEHVSLDPAKVQRMIALNVSALTELCGLAGAAMKARGRGTILNVASTAAFQPLPRFAAYAATKAYVVSLTHALAEELAPHGVQVAVLCPGTTKTPFLAAAGLDPNGAKRSVGTLADKIAMDPDKVAEYALEGLRRGERLIVPGPGNRGHLWLSRLFPDRVAAQAWQRLWG